MVNSQRIGPWLTAALGVALTTQGASSSPLASPNLDLSGLGQVTVAGSFDAVALYQYPGQRQGFQTNGTQAVLSQHPNGLLEILAASDAGIRAMCPFVLRNGTYVGLIVGGNFTSLGGVDARSIALIDTRTNQIFPHVGVEGTVTSMYCDQETETVYIGGVFEASTSRNAITWTANGAWANLPFSGFDGPVYAVTKAPNGNIVFGGAFTGLGNTTVLSTNRTRDETQLINLAAATITSAGNTTAADGIVCPGAATWSLQDASPGSWTATLRYGVEPTIIRLWNADGRGVKTWRLTALPVNGIMNLSYVDPATQERRYCDAFCPLADAADYQEFQLVNTVGMNAFRLDVYDWYGAGAGLRGLEVYQRDVFVYAIDANMPRPCAGNATVSTASTTGAWYATPSRQSTADYLTVVTGPTTVQSTEIVLEPDIQATGNYSVLIYTPGCIQDSSCSARAIVNVTATLTAGGGTTFDQQVYQTNDYDKYDPIYMGRIEARTGAFQPRVTIRPSGLQTDQLVVASRVRFILANTTGGLNSLFEFDPNVATVDANFQNSAINSAGNVLNPNAQIHALAVHDTAIYAAGAFTDHTFTNVMAFVDNQARSLSDGGLNGGVAAIYSTNTTLYLGGNFTGTNAGGGPDLNAVAAYTYADARWVALGTGLDGPVSSVAPLILNLTGAANETCIAFSGAFQNIRAAGTTPATPARGFAVWVPSRNAWLPTLDVAQQFYAGQLSAVTVLPNGSWIGAGTLQSLGQAGRGAVALRAAAPAGTVQLAPLPVPIAPAAGGTSPVRKRDLVGSQNITGVVTVAWDTRDNRNRTILGGHFSTTGTPSAAIDNLVIYDGTTHTVTGLPAGLDPNSTFLALAVQDALLVAAGAVSGRVGPAAVAGVVLYHLSNNTYRSPQPPALRGPAVVVSSVQPQPSSSVIYVGGSFEGTTSGLSCRSVCAYNTDANQWSTVGGQLDGDVAALYWVSRDELLAAGNLSVSGNRTMLARYHVPQQSWVVQNSSGIPGPVTAFGPGTRNGDHIWVAGTATNGSTYLMEVDGTNFRPVVNAFADGTVIRGLKILQLTADHGDTQYFDNDQALLVSGQLNLTGFGPASAALFNGTTMTPFLLASVRTGDSGIVNGVFSEKADNLRDSGSRHSRGVTIVVALCAALGTIFLIILVGIILNRIQRRRNGYATVPSMAYVDKHSNIARLPPERLFGSLGQRTGGAPTV